MDRKELINKVKDKLFAGTIGIHRYRIETYDGPATVYIEPDTTKILTIHVYNVAEIVASKGFNYGAIDADRKETRMDCGHADRNTDCPDHATSRRGMLYDPALEILYRDIISLTPANDTDREPEKVLKKIIYDVAFINQANPYNVDSVYDDLFFEILASFWRV